MLEITPEDILALNDTDLRELVARLCEAEVRRAGQSTAAVTWGGAQTAKDGGVDVHVALPAGAPWPDGGFIPRRTTGFQVKKPDMAAQAITDEMRPGGVLRPVIANLASAQGSYVIVSSSGTHSHTFLSKRRTAMRDAVANLSHADDLHLDFYDRRRLATWTNAFPGVLLWARMQSGRAVMGWNAWGPWTSAPIHAKDFIKEDTLRARQADRHLSTAAALEWACGVLSQPGRAVRLVGLSGVGKTRFAQALFEPSATASSLDPALVLYTNMNDGPNPQPVAAATNLVALGQRAVLVVDNCTAALHRQLAQHCGAPGSWLSLLTVEYDVREDQPEGTEVLSLEPASDELIGTLLQNRFPSLGGVDARRVVAMAGGNARIAIVLAEVVARIGEIGRLTDDDLFERLFWQRHAVDTQLLEAAKCLALVYSFNADPDSSECELESLGRLSEQTPRQLLAACSQLAGRDLLQQRGSWRAILPHAIANRLAGWALDQIPAVWLEGPQGLGSSSRLLRSFSRRLSMLGAHPQASNIAARWLAPGGLLGDLSTLTEDQRHMFVNIAPVDQVAALQALERADSVAVWREFMQVLRALAYKPEMFERCAAMLYRVATSRPATSQQDPARGQWLSLFQIAGSGTHATLAQRLAIAESLLSAADDTSHSMGTAAIRQLLATSGFQPVDVHEFGSRSRDDGYRARTDEEIQAWFAAVIDVCVRRMADHREAMVSALASNLHGLWTRAGMHAQVDALVRRIAADGFWLEGWIACCRILRQERKRNAGGATLQCIEALESTLRPAGLEQEALAVLQVVDWHLVEEAGTPSDPSFSSYARRVDDAKKLGRSLANEPGILSRLGNALHGGGAGAFPMGQGLAEGATFPRDVWQVILSGFKSLNTSKREPRALKGFLSELARLDVSLASELVQQAWTDGSLSDSLVELQLAIPLDAAGLSRLLTALKSGAISMAQLESLRHDCKQVDPTDLCEFLIAISEDQIGTHVATSILFSRVYDAKAGETEHPALREAARHLFGRLTLDESRSIVSDFEVSHTIRSTLTDKDGAPSAQLFARQLVRDLLEHRVYLLDYTDTLRALLDAHPIAVLDAWFEEAGGEADRAAALLHVDDFHDVPPSGVMPAEVVLQWCQKNPAERVLLAASFIPIKVPGGSEVSPGWSEQAKQLLQYANDKDAVLERLADQFSPSTTWVGSRATIFEMNAKLLDQLEEFLPSDSTPGLPALRKRLSQAIELEHARESRSQRRRDERFE